MRYGVLKSGIRVPADYRHTRIKCQSLNMLTIRYFGTNAEVVHPTIKAFLEIIHKRTQSVGLL